MSGLRSDWKRKNSSSLIWRGIILILLSFIVRLLYIFFIVPIDWMGDSYHHWQIALYTLKIGLVKGRMWDLKGCEYYWPPLPTLIELLLMKAFDSTSIMLMRVLNAILSSISVYIAFLIGNRLIENCGITVFSALLFFPFTLNTEVLALHEPMMGLFFLAGLILLVTKKRFYAGMSFGISYLCHFSIYLTVPIIIITILLYEKQIEAIIPFLTGFLLVYIPYSIFLGIHTGDVLYNLRSMLTYMLISTTQMKHPLANIFGLILCVLGFSLILNISNKSNVAVESFLVELLLGGYTFFWGVIFIFIGVPISNYEMRYYYIPLILSIIYLSTYMIRIIRTNHRNIQGLFGHPRSMFYFGITSLILLMVFSPTYSTLQNRILFDFNAADRIYEYYSNGTIISPVPDMTYRLINHWNVPPQSILGPKYCPIEQSAKNKWLDENNVTIFFWLPDMEADRVFPELSSGLDIPPFYLLESLGYNRYIYERANEGN